MCLSLWTNMAPLWSILMDLSIKGVPEEQVKRRRERAKANHRPKLDL